MIFYDTHRVIINGIHVTEVNNFPTIDEERKYSVYVLVDPGSTQYDIPTMGRIDHTPFYVGKGTKNRRAGHVTESKSGNNLPKNNKLRVLLKQYTIDQIFVPLIDGLTHEEAIEKEIELISILGRRHINNGLLCNITAGGEGRSEPHTETWKVQHSKRMTGSNNPSSKHSGWLCHVEKGSHYFAPGEFNTLCKELGLSKEARKLLVGYVYSFGGYVLSDVQMTPNEVESKLANIQLQRRDKFLAKMQQRREQV